jgi:hypothetical protein
MLKPLRIIRTEESTYADQYDQEHKCEYVIDSIMVTRTEEFIAWNYYTENIKDYIWVSECGRRFRSHTQTDYGPCTMPFEELDTRERVNFYRWSEPKEGKKVYAPFWSGPIIDDPSRYVEVYDV